MKKLISAIILCEAASLWGAAALDETTKILTFDVAEGVSETYSDALTADVQASAEKIEATGVFAKAAVAAKAIGMKVRIVPSKK